MKTIIRVTFAIFLMAAFFAFFFQRHALNEVHIERQRLKADAEAAVRLARENREIEKLRQENREIDGLRVANRDLYKLRNKVHLLRDQVKELAAVRAENERLRGAGALRTSNGALSAEARPWLTADQLSFAGYATPEATLQTLFWAVKQGDVESTKKCFTPETQKKMTEQPADDLRGEIERMSKRFQGIRVAARKVVSGEEIHLGAQINVADRETPDEAAFTFKLIDGAWRLDGAP